MSGLIYLPLSFSICLNIWSQILHDLCPESESKSKLKFQILQLLNKRIPINKVVKWVLGRVECSEPAGWLETSKKDTQYDTLSTQLAFSLSFRCKCNEKSPLWASFAMAPAAVVCAAASGLKRSGVTALSALCAAVRAHLRRPPPAPPRRPGIRGCLSFGQNTLPLEAVPLCPGVVVGFLRRVLVYLPAIRGHCPLTKKKQKQPKN